MSKNLSKIWLMLLCLNASLAVTAQVSNPIQSSGMTITSENDLKINVSQEAVFANMNEMFRFRQNISTTPPDKKIPKYFKSIVVSNADVNKYHDFLRGSKSGIVRLQDFSNCKRDREKCVEGLSGNAGSYSFRDNIYIEKSFADILFDNAYFHIEALNTLGFLIDLGDTPLENLSLKTDGIREMVEFQPSNQLAEVEKHIAIAKNGFQVGNFLYKTALPFKENSTYALRTIVYRVIDKSSVTQKKADNKKAEPRRRDEIIIFRCIRKHDDGSISLLWKQLQDNDSPTIEINK